MVALPSRPSHLEKAFKFTYSTEPTLYYSQLKHRPHYIYIYIYIYIYPLKKLPLLFKKKKASIFLYLFGVQHLESNHGYFTPHLFILIHSFCSSKPQSAITRIIRFSGFGFRFRSIFISSQACYYLLTFFNQIQLIFPFFSDLILFLPLSFRFE